MSSFNKHGHCPNCNTDFDGGDILQVLSNLSVFAGKGQKEVLKFATETYGYTIENQRRFSNTIAFQLAHSGTVYYRCPSCRAVFDANSHRYVVETNEQGVTVVSEWLKANTEKQEDDIPF